MRRDAPHRHAGLTTASETTGESATRGNSPVAQCLCSRLKPDFPEPGSGAKLSPARSARQSPVPAQRGTASRCRPRPRVPAADERDEQRGRRPRPERSAARSPRWRRRPVLTGAPNGDRHGRSRSCHRITRPFSPRIERRDDHRASGILLKQKGQPCTLRHTRFRPGQAAGGDVRLW